MSVNELQKVGDCRNTSESNESNSNPNLSRNIQDFMKSMSQSAQGANNRFEGNEVDFSKFGNIYGDSTNSGPATVNDGNNPGGVFSVGNSNIGGAPVSDNNPGGVFSVPGENIAGSAPTVNDNNPGGVFSIPESNLSNNVSSIGDNTNPGGVFSIPQDGNSDNSLPQNQPQSYNEASLGNTANNMNFDGSNNGQSDNSQLATDNSSGSGNGASGLQHLVKKMGRLDNTLAKDFAGSADGGASALASATFLEQTMLSDPNLAQDTKLDSAMLGMDKQLANLISTMPGGEQMLSGIMQAQQQALTTIDGGGGSGGGGSGGSGSGGTGGTGGDGGGSGGTGGGSGGTGGDGGSGGTGGSGTDMSSLFTAGDSGVTSAEMQHAISIADQLPPDIQQALLKGGASMTLLSGFNGGPEGENNGTQGDFYVDSGMADQAEVHELYEMAGQISPTTIGGSWNDQTAVGLADTATQNIMNGTAPGGDPGDLNDTIPGPNGVNQGGETIQGNGDLMSNAFVADFFASHPGLDQDSVGQSVLQSTEADAPQLEAYIAQQQGLTNVDAGGTNSFNNNSSSDVSSSTAAPINSAQWNAAGTQLAAALGMCGCHCYLQAGQSIEF